MKATAGWYINNYDTKISDNRNHPREEDLIKIFKDHPEAHTVIYQPEGERGYRRVYSRDYYEEDIKRLCQIRLKKDFRSQESLEELELASIHPTWGQAIEVAELLFARPFTMYDSYLYIYHREGTQQNKFDLIAIPRSILRNHFVIEGFVESKDDSRVKEIIDYINKDRKLKISGD